MERVQGVYEDYKSKVLYPFMPLLQGFRVAPIVNIDTLGVRRIFFLIFVMFTKFNSGGTLI